MNYFFLADGLGSPLRQQPATRGGTRKKSARGRSRHAEEVGHSRVAASACCSQRQRLSARRRCRHCRIGKVDAVTVVLAKQPQVLELRQRELGSLHKLKHGTLVFLDTTATATTAFPNLPLPNLPRPPSQPPRPPLPSPPQSFNSGHVFKQRP